MDIEIKEYTEPGYSPVIDYESWRVAILNDIDEFAKLEKQKQSIKSAKEEKRKIIEASIKAQQEMQSEYQNETDDQTKLYTEVTSLETQKRFKEIELNSLIKKIKQCF